MLYCCLMPAEMLLQIFEELYASSVTKGGHFSNFLQRFFELDFIKY